MGRLEVIKKNQTLSDKAYEVIKEAIISNKLKPGEVLGEEKLAYQLKISRTPIKAALLRLVYEEIAEVNESKNVVVSDITKQDIDNITIVRKSLEPLAVLLLANNLKNREIKILREILKEQSKMVYEKNNKDYIELDYEFHIKIAEFSKNSFLIDMVKKANLITKRFLILSGTVSNYNRIANDEHLKIIEYLENKKYTLASEAMREHLDNVNMRMLKH
ncbi:MULTISPECIES: GntR family transcriptional regulator [Clostridium]|uniref:GntR family transcriptional regulator n=1 Tax=Clostridium cibarium TaxID=2762247 RepID=A0ABR8PQN2_9CLOT|nr:MULTISPECIES: GntR family transcriptional regulator [Clostridium]MBD7910484.1 GntR family transcriptional regulator [Clostridium cibarium]